MNITITALYASLLALVFIYLSFKVIGLRRSLKVGVGDGGEKLLTKAIRVHGNFSEYIPLALLLLACFEFNGANPLWVHLLGATLLLGRFLHAAGLSNSIGATPPRVIGMILTFLVLLILSVANISSFIMS